MNKDLLKKCLGIFFKIVLPCFILFSILLFPIKDLRHVISQRIALATQGQVALDFSDISLNIIPKPSIELERVIVSSPRFSAIKVASLQISPSILGLITFKPGVALYGEGFFGGNVDLSLRTGSKNSKDQPTQLISLNASNISLLDTLDFLNIGIKGNGNAHIALSSTLDPNGQESEATVNVDARDIKLPENTILTQFGSVSIPPASISVLQIDGQLKMNKFRITKGAIGKEGDTITGSVEGSIDVRVMATPQGPQIVPTGYNLVLRLRLQNSFLNSFALKPVIESFKSTENDRETTFNIGLSATNLRAPPAITKIQ